MGRSATRWAAMSRRSRSVPEGAFSKRLGATFLGMMTQQRLADISRYHDLVRDAMASSTKPLTMLQRQVLIDMMGELLDHAQATVPR